MKRPRRTTDRGWSGTVGSIPNLIVHIRTRLDDLKMEPARVRRELLGSDAELHRIADDLWKIGARFAAKQYEPIQRGNLGYRGLSWRCQAIAQANTLRGEELLRFAILAINEGALITAFVLARALDETLAAVVFAKRKLQRAIQSNDPG